MTKLYDDQNIFAKILRGDIPNNRVLENAYVLAFHDIAPKAPIHIVLIPKKSYVDADDFGAHASDAETKAMFQAITDIVKSENLMDGYRLIANTGVHGGQEVPHFHMHILGGEPIGKLRG